MNEKNNIFYCTAFGLVSSLPGLPRQAKLNETPVLVEQRRDVERKGRGGSEPVQHCRGRRRERVGAGDSRCWCHAHG